MSELTSGVSGKKETIWTKGFIQIFIINAVISLGQFMMGALVPKFAGHLGASATIVGMVAGMFAISALAVRPVVGPATGYFRKDRLLTMTVGIICLAFLCYGMAHSVAAVIAGRLLHGVGMGFLAPVCLAIASDALPNSKMMSGIGVYSLGQAVSTAVGPTLGLQLVSAVGYNMTFYLGAALMGATLLFSLRLKTDEPVRQEKFKISLRSVIAPEVLIPAVIMFFLGGAYSCVNSFMLIYGAACGVEQIGLFFTAYAVCLLVSRPITGKIADKYGVGKAIVPGMLIFMLSFVLISFARSLPMFLAAGAISAFGYGICQPSMQAICMKMVPKERRGVAGNTNYIGVDLGYLVTPMLGGAIVSLVQNGGGTEATGYSVMFRVMTVSILIALAVFLVKRRKLAQDGPEQAPQIMPE